MFLVLFGMSVVAEIGSPATLGVSVHSGDLGEENDAVNSDIFRAILLALCFELRHAGTFGPTQPHMAHAKTRET